MLYFALGFISALVLSVLVVATLTFFRCLIESKINVVTKSLENAGPRPKGFIMNPETNTEEMRRKIIEKNQKQGLDTPIKDLL